MGMTLIDASVIIAVLHRDDAHHAEALAAVREEGQARRTLALSAITWAEVLTGLRIRGRAADADVAVRLGEEAMTILPVDRSIAERAAEIRADHHRRRRGRLGTPDAIVLGTAAADARVDRVITADSKWAAIRLEGVAISVLGT